MDDGGLAWGCPSAGEMDLGVSSRIGRFRYGLGPSV